MGLRFHEVIAFIIEIKEKTKNKKQNVNQNWENLPDSVIKIKSYKILYIYALENQNVLNF